jgi:hypothetical protein
VVFFGGVLPLVQPSRAMLQPRNTAISFFIGLVLSWCPRGPSACNPRRSSMRRDTQTMRSRLCYSPNSGFNPRPDSPGNQRTIARGPQRITKWE